MERTREPPQSEQGEQLDAERPRPPDLARFHTLIAATVDRPVGEKTAAAGTLNDLLIAMRAPGNDPEEAAEILTQLDLGSLTDFTDSGGRNCRKEAVETLMAMGFPHALKVSEEDFEFARKWAGAADALYDDDRWRQALGLRLGVAACAFLGSGIPLWALAQSHRPNLESDPYTLWLFSVVASASSAIWMTKDARTRAERSVAAFSLGAATLLSLGAVILMGFFGFLGTVVLGFATALAYLLGDATTGPA